MKATNPNGTRYERYKLWNKTADIRYDYAKHGVLVNVMSHRITDSKNPMLRMILGFVEKSIVFLLKYTDELKNFKNICFKNR